MAKYPTELTTLIAYLKKLPGVGTKTAERFAFHVLDWPETQIKDFSNHLSQLKEKITHCPTCHCLAEAECCSFCTDPLRNRSQLCIIATPKDAFALEETGTYRGLYHV